MPLAVQHEWPGKLPRCRVVQERGPALRVVGEVRKSLVQVWLREDVQRPGQARLRQLFYAVALVEAGAARKEEA